MKAETVIVEYLVLTKQEDTFCNSAESFIKLLDLDSSIEINENSITISIDKKEKFSVFYSLVSGLVPSKNERYFKLKLSSNKKDKLSEFTELIRRLESIIQKLHNEVSINVLWNDIAREYAVQGYSLINEVENLLRRLIADFMIINVGYHWTKSHIPNEVASRDSKIKTNDFTDYLYQTQFSDIQIILFQGQRDQKLRDIGDVQKFVEKKKSDGKKQISVEELDGVIARSLWERYFSKGVNAKKETLEMQLGELTTLRNDIAHNRHISREKLGKIETLSRKIINTLNLVIEDLPNTNLTPEQQEFQVNIATDLIQTGEILQNLPKSFNWLSRVIADYYRVIYSDDKVIIVDDPQHVIDILIDTVSDQCIAVQIQYFKRYNSTMISKYIRQCQRILIDEAETYKNYSEFHFVIVCRDGISENGLIDIDVISSFYSALYLKAVWVVGYLDENNNFIKSN
ncbi:hypothetical protein GO730_10895 [Spirosoma sp. HMF3257]|uniref:Uncharacterized protein n=1 Tax=Spirosoma telluris TaxID=2183553 RepID=A0A327NPN5_9BACT|nr:hypothetical protein [Spirosoma telluris]RAI74638.1 hypothetical protein HMF3257_10820 [Spirosoma telluris]